MSEVLNDLHHQKLSTEEARTRMRAELIQVAAMAADWADALS